MIGVLSMVSVSMPWEISAVPLPYLKHSLDSSSGVAMSGYKAPMRISSLVILAITLLYWLVCAVHVALLCLRELQKYITLICKWTKTQVK